MIPYTTHQVVFNIDVTRRLRDGRSFGGIIGIMPREDAEPGQALAEVEEIMRIRHGLKLDEPNDFDVITQDALLRTWEQISQAVLLALVVISSIALMVGGIGVMAIMMISVTERTREIGVQKGARRAAAGNPDPVPGRGGGADARSAGSSASSSAPPSASASTWRPAFPSRCRGGRSPSASASRRRSASSSAWCRPCARRSSTRSKRCGTNRRKFKVRTSK